MRSESRAPCWAAGPPFAPACAPSSVLAIPAVGRRRSAPSAKPRHRVSAAVPSAAHRVTRPIRTPPTTAAISPPRPEGDPDPKRSAGSHGPLLPPNQSGSSAPAPAPWTALAPNGSRLFWFLDRGQWLGRFAACPNVPEVPYITKNYLDDVLVRLKKTGEAYC